MTGDVAFVAIVLAAHVAQETRFGAGADDLHVAHPVDLQRLVRHLLELPLEPVIRGTRVLNALVIGPVGGGMAFEDLQRIWPHRVGTRAAPAP